MRNPNGYGSVHKLSGNRRNPYRVRITKGWTDEGKQIYENIGYFASRSEALIALAKYNESPYNLKDKDLTFTELYDKWLESKEDSFTQGNINFYRSAYINAPKLHDMTFKHIRADDINKAIKECSKGDGTKRKIKILCSQLFKYAMENDIVVKDYSKFVTFKKEDDEKEKNPFTIEEIRHVLSSSRIDYRYDVVAILLFTGMRINELLKMTNDKVYLDKGYMQGGSKTRAGKNRIIPISNHIRHIIERLYDADNDYLITTPKGKQLVYSTFNTWWIKTELIAHTIHETRHTFISLCDSARLNPIAIKKIVGHASTDITEKVYTHKAIEELRLELNKLDDYMKSVL